MHIHTHTKQKRARAQQNMHIRIYTSCAHISTQNFMTLVLIVHNFVMTFKFHDNPIFFCGDIYKLTLNMHTRGKNECAKSPHARVHIFTSCTHICVQIFTQMFLVVHYSVFSLSFKFHKDPIFHCKIERCFFFYASTISWSIWAYLG